MTHRFIPFLRTPGLRGRPRLLPRGGAPRIVAIAVALTPIGAPAWAFDCPPADIVYESDEANPADYNDAYGPTSFRFDGDDLVLTADGTETRFTLIDRIGPEGTRASYYDFGDPQQGYFETRRWDVSRIAQDDEPDHFITFGGALYWPRCDRAD